MMGPQAVEAALVEAARVWAWGNGRVVVHRAAVEPGAMVVDGDAARRVRAREGEFVTTGGGAATDGPWHLHRPLFSERYDSHADGAARVIEQAVRSPRPDPAMMARAEVAAGWLSLVAPHDRRLVILAVRALASGRARVPWTGILRAMGLERGRGGLARRYQLALVRISDHLNAANSRL